LHHEWVWVCYSGLLRCRKWDGMCLFRGMLLAMLCTATTCWRGYCLEVAAGGILLPMGAGKGPRGEFLRCLTARNPILVGCFDIWGRG